MLINRRIAFLTTAIVISQLTGCFDSSNELVKPPTGNGNTSPTITQHHAIINMADPNFADYDLAFVDLSKSNWAVNEGGYAGKGSDYALATYGEHFYRIGRYSYDSISKYSIRSPKKAIYTYSTNDAGRLYSNPYDIIFVNESKAYVIRYGDTKVWVINPSATNQSAFKINDIDLSAYADADGIPEMSAGVIVEGKLYITLQKLAEDWAPSNTSSVIVINTSTDKVEREIPLQTTNAGAIVYHPDAGLFVQSDGDKLCFACLPKKKSGGIEKVNINNNTTEVIAWDNSEYGFNKLTIADANTAYVSKYYGWGDQGVYKLDLNSKTISSQPLDGLNHVEIRHLTVHENKLWVSIAGYANPRINLYDLPSEQAAGQLATAFYPEEVKFIKK